MTIEKVAETPGVFAYRCASGPVTDLHIKSGNLGAMIVYPRNEHLRPAREAVVVEDAVYAARDEQGFIPGIDPVKAQKAIRSFSMFNGRLDKRGSFPSSRGIPRRGGRAIKKPFPFRNSADGVVTHTKRFGVHLKHGL